MKTRLVDDRRLPMGRINRFTTRAEAQLACGLLTAHGFRAVVMTDDVGGMRPDVGFGIGGTVVLVPDEDYPDAVALLDAVLAEASDDPSEGP